MNYEYLVFNIVVISGPLFFGSLRRFYFWNHLKEAVIAILFAAVPMLIWDVSVTNRHWFFADEYTLGLRIFELPIEEILFFLTVPFACLFTWEMVKRHSNPPVFRRIIISNRLSLVLSSFFVLASVPALMFGKEYTFLASLFFAASILFDRIYGASILNSEKFFFFFSLVTFFTLIFNGYLTWRPIVTYDALYQLDFRIFTVPIEDFFFGYALLIICTSLFEKMLVKKNHIT